MAYVNGEPCDPPTITQNKELTDNRRNCWVCLASDEDDTFQPWVKPCLCRGTSKWVHQLCLQRWIDEKQRGNSLSPVSCSQCNAIYIIIYPKSGYTMHLLDMIEGTIQKTCPYIAFSMLVGAVYWSAVSYGSCTIIQIFGKDEAIKLMDEADPFFLLVSLPTIPIMLIVGKMVSWEDYLLRFWVQHFPTRSSVGVIGPADPVDSQGLTSSIEPQHALIDPAPTLTRVVCGALIFPTIASLVGRLLFKNVTSSFHRTVMGGATFIVAKGFVKMCYKHQVHIRKMKRKIVDYEEIAIVNNGENT